jgi:hypothetical protein
MKTGVHSYRSIELSDSRLSTPLTLVNTAYTKYRNSKQFNIQFLDTAKGGGGLTALTKTKKILFMCRLITSVRSRVPTTALQSGTGFSHKRDRNCMCGFCPYPSKGWHCRILFAGCFIYIYIV